MPQSGWLMISVADTRKSLTSVASEPRYFWQGLHFVSRAEAVANLMSGGGGNRGGWLITVASAFILLPWAQGTCDASPTDGQMDPDIQLDLGLYVDRSL